MQNVTLQISGMSCGHCVASVSKALAAVPGVEVEAVEIGSARLRIDPARASLDQVKDAVNDQGYEAVEAA